MRQLDIKDYSHKVQDYRCGRTDDGQHPGGIKSDSVQEVNGIQIPRSPGLNSTPRNFQILQGPIQ